MAYNNLVCIHLTSQTVYNTAGSAFPSKRPMLLAVSAQPIVTSHTLNQTVATRVKTIVRVIPTAESESYELKKGNQNQSFIKQKVNVQFLDGNINVFEMNTHAVILTVNQLTR